MRHSWQVAFSTTMILKLDVLFDEKLLLQNRKDSIQYWAYFLNYAPRNILCRRTNHKKKV